MKNNSNQKCMETKQCTRKDKENICCMYCEYNEECTVSCISKGIELNCKID